jgi:catechol 2,3-dioxygenase-like lactoylglutathione lyase family enzyme
MVDDVDSAVEFYVSMLGFELDQQFGPAIAILRRGDLELLVAGPQTSAAKPMSDGRIPSPGRGWSRFVLMVEDLKSVVADLESKGVTFLNDVVEQGGRKQILCIDPSGNVIELFQAESTTEQGDHLQPAE